MKGLAFGPEWLTSTQAAQYLPWPSKRIREMCAAGELEHWRDIGPGKQGRYYIHRDVIAALLRRHVIHPTRKAS